MTKKPAWKRDPGPVRKEVRGADKGAETNAMHFRWRASWVDLDGTWGFRNASCEALWQQILPRLHDLESMTWGEIYGKRDSSSHPMPVEAIGREAQTRLREIQREQYDTLFQINIRGGIRIWGIRDRAILYLLWYDPDHTVYVQKK